MTIDRLRRTVGEGVEFALTAIIAACAAAGFIVAMEAVFLFMHWVNR